MFLDCGCALTNHYHDNGRLDSGCPKTPTSIGEAEKVEVKADESTPTKCQIAPADPFSSRGFIDVAIDELGYTLRSKNEDYRIDGEFSNFELSAKLVGQGVDNIFRVLLATKEGRIYGLSTEKSPNNESLLDSYRDYAGYAVLRYAYHLSKEEK